MAGVINRGDWAASPDLWHGLGPELLQTIDIHANSEFVTEWLEYLPVTGGTRLRLRRCSDDGVGQ